MPRVNLNRNKHEKLVRIIRGAQYQIGKTDDELGRAMGVSRQTYANRMKRPEDLTIRELETLSRVLDIPIAEIRAEIGGV